MTEIPTSTPSLFSRQSFNPNAAKEKLEIVIGAAHFGSAQHRPPPFRPPAGGFAGGFPRRLRRRNAFGLIQEYCTTRVIKKT